MTSALAESDQHEPTIDRQRCLTSPLWRRFTALQLVVLALASVPPLVIAGATAGHLLGFLTQEALIDTALAAGEEPGMLTFAAMFLASPVQWLTGRSQVRVRKFLGIVFFMLALSNGAVVAIALVGHTVLMGEFGFGSTFILLGFILRIPTVRDRLKRRSATTVATPLPVGATQAA